eukprot:GHVT01002633.1.p1 GENE.GHVT01002633.1~~GHVT01002633.1.p1  ORF type:complete len:278 (-),score=55.44 GHVT01002633.1:360-1193(-)
MTMRALLRSDKTAGALRQCSQALPWGGEAGGSQGLCRGARFPLGRAAAVRLSAAGLRVYFSRAIAPQLPFPPTPIAPTPAQSLTSSATWLGAVAEKSRCLRWQSDVTCCYALTSYPCLHTINTRRKLHTLPLLLRSSSPLARASLPISNYSCNSLKLLLGLASSSPSPSCSSSSSSHSCPSSSSSFPCSFASRLVFPVSVSAARGRRRPRRSPGVPQRVWYCTDGHRRASRSPAPRASACFSPSSTCLFAPRFHGVYAPSQPAPPFLPACPATPQAR